MRTLPGVAPNSNPALASSPNPAEPIPQNVLSSPIIGEARRFDGTIAPAGWLLMQGQTLSVDGYRAAFRILGTVGGGDGKTSFKMPAARPGWIVAVAGTFPSSPQVFAAAGRQVSALKSLGSGARMVARSLTPRQQETAARRAAAMSQEQRLVKSAITPRNVYASRPSPETVARMTHVHDDARTAVLAILSAQNRAQALGLADAVVAGGSSIFDATRRMAASLTPAESAAVLSVFDAGQRSLGGSPGVHADAADEAGRYVVQLVFSADQLRRLRAMQRDD